MNEVKKLSILYSKLNDKSLLYTEIKEDKPMLTGGIQYSTLSFKSTTNSSKNARGKARDNNLPTINTTLCENLVKEKYKIDEIIVSIGYKDPSLDVKYYNDTSATKIMNIRM